MAIYSKHSDYELASLLKDGDHAAYAEIYRRYHALLYLYAYKKLKDKETSKDVVQEIYLSLWNKRESCTFHSDLAGYLYRAVRNRAFDIFAHQKVEQQYFVSLQNFWNTDEAKTDYLLREKEIAAIIDAEIALMPKGMREVFVLSRKQYLSHKEIAETLDISEEAVNKQVKRALKTLRVRLGLVVYLMVCFEYVIEQPKIPPKKNKLSSTQNVPLG